MYVIFEMEKTTRNTVRFKEVQENELDAPKIGTLYVPKATLSEIGWKSGMLLGASLVAAEEVTVA